MKDKSKIFLILCYARSGGTVLNRFLSNINRLIVLSEAHPLHNKKGGIYSIKNQLLNWYNVKVTSDNYIEQIVEAKEWCDKNDKFLVIRDWSYIDFAKSYLNSFAPPRISTNIILLQKYFNVQCIAFVRNSIDVYLSSNESLEKFCREYSVYVDFLLKKRIPIFKYEDFVMNSLYIYNQIAKELGITIIKDNKDIDKILNFKAVGDINISRGNGFDNIVLLPRKYIFFWKRKAINSSCLQELNEKFNYSLKYEDRKIEPFKSYWSFKTKKTIFYIKKAIEKVKI